MATTRKTGSLKEMVEMVKHGKDALTVLGEEPIHDSKTFKTFEMTHYGQWVYI